VLTLQSSRGIVLVLDDKTGGDHEEYTAQHLHKTGGE